MNIAENIKRLREDYGLTQSELGKIAGVSDKAVSKWEHGTAEPRMGAVQKIADYLHITKSKIVESYDDVEEKIIVSSDEMMLLKRYRELNQSGKDEAYRYLRYLSFQHEYVEEK